MLYRGNRLHTRISQQFYEEASHWGFSWGMALYQLNSDLVTPQVAIWAPKKYFPKSVERHRVKRQLSTLLRERLVDFPPGLYIFSLNRKFLTMQPTDLIRDLLKFRQHCNFSRKLDAQGTDSVVK